MSHALPKQQTLLDCFLEAQAKRTKRRRRSADAATAGNGLDQANGPSADDAEALAAENDPADAKAARAV
ncbi:hypothetical protein [Bradyrhizobium sp. ORS 375]|uniref:hypothetical protein n=1 Tax=Bradyrhizobium sp. (strain ORS 375) TaxID=566679 RepID=UPI0002E325E7|nr:hypothetical protein [Bradyrhizobium sp. ORS 375]